MNNLEQYHLINLVWIAIQKPNLIFEKESEIIAMLKTKNFNEATETFCAIYSQEIANKTKQQKYFEKGTHPMQKEVQITDISSALEALRFANSNRKKEYNIEYGLRPKLEEMWNKSLTLSTSIKQNYPTKELCLKVWKELDGENNTIPKKIFIEKLKSYGLAQNISWSDGWEDITWQNLKTWFEE